MTRRDAVKLGGSALAAAGLAAGACSATPAAQGTDLPDFRGKVVVCCVGDERMYHTLAAPLFETRAGRLFLTGRVPDAGCWSDGLSGAVAWDAVNAYLVYDSAEDYEARRKAHQDQGEAKK
jgi:hypothetical protein